MSSRFILKITLTSSLILVHLVLPSLLMPHRRDVETIGSYYSGKCANRSEERYATTKCSQYLYCDPKELGRAEIKDCKSPKPVFNITSKECETNTTPPCNDGDKVRVREWLRLEARHIKTLSDGKMLAIPPTAIYLKKNFDNLNKFFNTDFNVLLKTSFLAVEDGAHTFSSDCIPWCKIWIRRDICGTPELVLHQKEMGHSHKEVEYHVQRNYTMKFGTFYYLTIVHIGKASGVFKFQIEVKWPGENKKKIPAVLLRLPPEKKCPKHPSIHVTPTATTSHFVRQSPNRTVPLTTGTLPLTGILSSTGSSTPTGSSIFTGTLPITGILSRIRSSTSTGSSILTGTLPLTGILSWTRSLVSSGNSILTETSTVTGTSTLAGTSSPTGTLTTTDLLAPTSLTQTSAMLKSTPTRQYTTPSSSTTSPVAELSSKCKVSFQDCANGLNKILTPNEQTNPSSQEAKDTTGLSIARILDLNGEKFAENWNRIGKSKTLYYKKFVMEVSFPLTNYSFPRGNITDRFGKEFQSDQIFIPVQALATENGEFKRKVYSVLYLDLDKKMPRSINVVETETNQIPGSYQLNSHVIASTAVPRISGLKSYDIVIRLAHLNTNFNPEIKPMCVFLKWNNDVNSDGVWSTEGCKLDSDLSNQNVSVCRCNHLTHFGVLMQVHTHKLSSNDVKALKLISYIGCALSLIGACLTMLAIMCLPGARSDRNFIHVNLAVAIGLAQVTFLAGIDETGYEVICTMVAALLHYFLLVAFSWMLIEGLFLHILIVKVFHDHLPKKRFYVAFCWGLPLLIVLLSVNLLRDGYGTKTSCWLSTDKATIWTFSGPAILVMIINIIILCKVMKEINSLRTSDRRDSHVRSVRYGVRSTIILLPLLGLTWAFGLICVNDGLVVFQYLFTIFNSLQGLFIFLFHCVFNTEVRKAFWRKVDIWFTNHNHPYGNNAHSRSKSNNDPSSIITPDKDKKTPPRNGLSMYSFDELTERQRRKLSTATASTCIDPWPHKLSLTPSVDGPYPARFTPSLSSDDIKYQPICKQDAGQKRISPKNPGTKVGDLNGNTHNLDGDSGLQKDGANSVQNNATGSNLAKNEQSVLEEKQPNTNSQQQQIAQISSKNIETPKSSEESYIQKQPNTQKPRPTKKTSHESLGDGRNVVGIGGHVINSGDSAGHVRIIDVNNSTGSFGTKL